MTTAFNAWVTAEIRKRFRRSIVGFGDLVRDLPGILPSVTLHAIRRLVSNHILTDADYQECIHDSGFAKTRWSDPWKYMLPIPHMLDAEWRFMPESNRIIVDLATDLVGVHEAITLLGCPTTALALTDRWRGAVTLVESNELVLEHIRRYVPTNFAFQQGISTGRVSGAGAGLVIADPPWYSAEILRFLSAAANMCRVGGYVLLFVPPIGTRPGVRSEIDALVDEADRRGSLRLMSPLQGKVRYATPFFEYNAMRAAGVPCIPCDWRAGDVLIFQKESGSSWEVPGQSSGETKWVEIGWPGSRVKFAVRSNDWRRPGLGSVVTGDVLPTVSRRDPRVEQVSVWTSGNRVFDCGVPMALAAAMMVDRGAGQPLLRDPAIVSTTIGQTVEGGVKAELLDVVAHEAREWDDYNHK